MKRTLIRIRVDRLGRKDGSRLIGRRLARNGSFGGSGHRAETLDDALNHVARELVPYLHARLLLGDAALQCLVGVHQGAVEIGFIPKDGIVYFVDELQVEQYLEL